MERSPHYYSRWLERCIHEAMNDTPVVYVAGPRQAGKTTLVKKVAGGDLRYLSLDDELTLLAAKKDPVGFIRDLDRTIIDEIQRAPKLLMAIKKAVDEDRRPGRFLLTGSANLMTLPTVADSLAGRMESLTLLPLSQSELHASTTNWIDSVFSGALPAANQLALGADLSDIVVRGGYPEVISRSSQHRRTAWINQYVSAILQRDVRDIGEVAKLEQLPRFIRALALLSGQMCNYSKLGGQVSLDHKTAARYIGIFEQMYLLSRLEPWASNRLKRVVKTPKIQFLDSGLLSALVNLPAASVQERRKDFGHVLESFVYGELQKHATTSDVSCQLYYYRDHNQREVDFVLESVDGALVGIEVKASATVSERDLRGLEYLATVVGERFKLGVVLYDGSELLPLGDKLFAAPISSLWGV